jgi:serine/threonine protein phosphatase PrpC
MEDAHVMELDVVEGEVSVFGVFDGHGGCEVAHFVENHLVDELKKNENFKKGNYRQALSEVFLLIDKMLLNESGKKELLKISQKHNASGSSAASMDGGDLAI